MTTQHELADRFRALHDPAAPLALANVWDAAGAAIVAAAGAPAVATTSAGVAWGLGAADGGHLDRDLMLGQLARIVAASGGLPVTADIEAGFGDAAADVAETVARVLDTGAIGVNIEDALPIPPSGSADPLRPIEEQAERLAAARAAADRAGIALYINARIDVFRLHGVDQPRRMTETFTRARAYLDAGASGVFLLGVYEPETIAELTAGIDAPVNVSGNGSRPVAELGKLGVARVSLGASTALAAYGVLDRMARELHGGGRAESLDYDVLNSLLEG